MTKLIQTFLLQRQPPSAGARTGEDNPVDDEDWEENVDNDDEEIGDDDDDDDDDDDPGDDERGQHWGVGAPRWGRALTRCSSQAQGKMSVTVLSQVSTRFNNKKKQWKAAMRNNHHRFIMRMTHRVSMSTSSTARGSTIKR